MQYTPRTIAGFRHGKQANKKPFLFFDDAFQTLDNAYQWRDRIKRVQPHRLLGRLRRNLSSHDITSAAGTGSAASSINMWTVLGIESSAQAAPGDVSAITISFDGGKDTLTDSAGTGVLTLGGSAPVFTGSWTLDYNTGDVQITGGDTGAGYAQGTVITVTLLYYPVLPAMGISTLHLAEINAEATVAFDTKYAYQWNAASKTFIDISTTPSKTTTWSGSDHQFFQSQNAYNKLFVTNNVSGFHGYSITSASGDPTVFTTPADHDLQTGDNVQFINIAGPTELNGRVHEVTRISATQFSIDEQTTVNATQGAAVTSKYNIFQDGVRYYDDNIDQWYNFSPALNTTTILQGARITVFYRDRIVALSTWEGSDPGVIGTEFHNRARYSQNGTPFVMDPDASTTIEAGAEDEAWREDVIGRGGFIDCPTNEHIVGAEFLKDTLIVMFERSRWRLRYTGNELLPFIWERINIDIGLDAANSVIAFDDAVVGVASRGIAGTDGTNTVRVDDEIPDAAFSFENENNGPARIHGIRDFQERIVYWTFPSSFQDAQFPNKGLIWNYVDKTWGNFVDCFTCFGYLQETEDDLWVNDDGLWVDDNTLWYDPTQQALHEQIIGGNQQGFIRVLQDPDGDLHNLTIRGISKDGEDRVIIESDNHCLQSGQIVKLSDIAGSANAEALNDALYQVYVDDDSDPSNTFRIYSWSDDEYIPVRETGSLSYTGKGVISIISSYDIRTKEFIPFIDQASSGRIGYMDFYANTTSVGRFLLNIYADGNLDEPVNIPDELSPLQNRVETFVTPYEMFSSEKRWVTSYNEAVGNAIQLQLTLGPDEMDDEQIALSPLELYAITLWVEKSSARLS